MARFPQSGFVVLLELERHCRTYVVAEDEKVAEACLAYASTPGRYIWLVYYAGVHDTGMVLTGSFAQALCAHFEVEHIALEVLTHLSPAELYERACVLAEYEGRPKPAEPQSMTGNHVLASFVRRPNVKHEKTVIAFRPRKKSEDA